MASSLTAGNQVLTKSGHATITSVKKQSGRQKVYNLEVRDLHNFLVGDFGVVVHNLCKKGKILEFLDDVDFDVNLAKVENPKVKDGLSKLKAMKDGNHADYQKFLDDFADDLPVESIKAWKGVIDFPNVRKDIDFLESFSKTIGDVELTGINIENRIKDWIQKSHLKCRSCANGSEPFLDEVLDNLYNFKAFLSKPGATKVIDDIGKSTRGAKGANWVMRFTKEKGINPSAFEEIITDGRKFTADIVEGSGSSVKYFECKSWDSSMKGLFTSGNTNFAAQFTNYLHNGNIMNLSQFGYHFNPAKWTPNASELNSALKASSNLFQINQWSKYQQLFQFTNSQVSPNDIDGLIDFITNNKFNKIINP